MGRHYAILLLIIILQATECFSQNVKDKELREEIRKHGEADVVIPYPGRTAIDSITRNVSITSVKNKKVYITLSQTSLEWFLSNKFDYEILKREPAKGITHASSVKEAMEWDTYPTYTQYDSIMHQFAADYPQLCLLDTIGTSVNGRLVLVLKISDNVHGDEDEPEVFYSSTMHGDELAGFVLMMRFADFLLKNYGSNTLINALVDNLEIWINPLANPDGTYNSGDIISSPTRTNANGYDLNRNFPDPMNPSVIQQKETTDMIAFMRKRKFVLSANFHSGEEVVNFPWDRWFDKYHADHDWFYYISRKYADTVHFYSGPAYMNFMDNGVTRGAEWYIIYGGRQDFITWELQGREVTIELDDIKLTPAAQLELLWLYNRQSLLGYLENALYGIHGKVTDFYSGLPVPAKVYISGHDRDSSHVYCDSLTGRFTRFLFQGVWNLTFSADGYRDTIISGIEVVNGQKTTLAIQMRPSNTAVDTSKPEEPVIFPNPARERVKCILPESFNGPVRITIISNNGAKIADYITTSSPVIINVTNLGAGIYTIVFHSVTTDKTLNGRLVVISHNY